MYYILLYMLLLCVARGVISVTAAVTCSPYSEPSPDTPKGMYIYACQGGTLHNL